MVYFIDLVIAMRLMLQRDVSASAEEFVLYDECGGLKYRVTCKQQKLVTNYNIMITDSGGALVAKIRRLPIFGTHTYVLRAGKRHITLAAVVTARGVLCNFYGNNWHVSGDFGAKCFTVIDVDKTPIMTLCRHARYHELEIADEGNELFCVMTAVCACLINTIENYTVQTV